MKAYEKYEISCYIIQEKETYQDVLIQIQYKFLQVYLNIYESMNMIDMISLLLRVEIQTYYTYEQFNFSFVVQLILVLMKSFTARLYKLLPNIYQINKSVLLPSTVRSNVWTCIKINTSAFRITTGGCLLLGINKINFQCKQISSLESSIVLGLIIALFKLTLCTSLSQNNSYNEHACKQETEGKSCFQDYQNRDCKLFTENTKFSFIWIKNKENCIRNTLGICKWNPSEYKCMNIINFNTTIANNQFDLVQGIIFLIIIYLSYNYKYHQKNLLNDLIMQLSQMMIVHILDLVAIK
ncbi:hypothetical protein pb186bvf_021063 [Paramecium bursaria]